MAPLKYFRLTAFMRTKEQEEEYDGGNFLLLMGLSSWPKKLHRDRICTIILPSPTDVWLGDTSTAENKFLRNVALLRSILQDFFQNAFWYT
jgi:hypothetical protein